MQSSYRASCPSPEPNHAGTGGRHSASTSFPGASEPNLDPPQVHDKLKSSTLTAIIGIHIAASGTPYEDAIGELVPEILVEKAIKNTRELWRTVPPEIFVECIARDTGADVRSLRECPSGCSAPWEVRTEQAHIALLRSLRDEEREIERQASRNRRTLEARLEDLHRKRGCSIGNGDEDRVASAAPTEVIDDNDDE